MLPSNENILWFVKIRLEDVDLFFAKKKNKNKTKTINKNNIAQIRKERQETWI